ncbi:MAG: ATP-binding cassette domain-containing protein, partial [Rhodospirillales bacterium]|nr:ATP-binding cassette domain-containing protein [Rhodospirillales bacterium]
FRGRDLAKLNEEEVRAVRGREIAMVFQDPMTSLNPVLRIARQLVEAMTAHGRFTAAAARTRAIDLLRRMGVASAQAAVDRYPHQFSGGMRQRVMLAMGVSNEPALLIADEPTTALDVTIQAQILELLRGLNADLGTAVILISHDLGVIANVCSRILVMYAGEVVEEGAPEDLLTDPRHPYTWALLHAAPRIDAEAEDRRLVTIEGQPPDPRAWPSGCRFRARCPFAIDKCAEHPALLPIDATRASRCWVTQAGGALHEPARPKPQARDAQAVAAPQPMLEVRGLTKHFPLPRETLFAEHRVLRAVDGVDLDVMAGETVGLVGESGCGKSTLARLVTRLHEPTGGSIRFAGTDITHGTQAEIRPL